MPELPEVERWRRCIDAVELHRRIEDVDLKGPTLLDGVAENEVQERLESASFERTARRGKYVFAALEQGDGHLLDPGTMGRLVGLKHADPPPEHTRLLIRFADGPGAACVSEGQRGRILHIALGWSPKSDHLPSSWLLPHRVGGGACPHCNRTLEEVALGGQTAVFCPHCQRMPKRRARQVSEARQKGPSR